ncbi:Speckle-type POZ protein like [Argiope bruennichi]|uniref:Speckle-type POZ protein like n=1 Tax=Argiope bruennichi TaxID=94029 RepID=A0A8T0EE97_ARGBR|nr:Speckle-type POZ protein like [Argiope bruennichi]
MEFDPSKITDGFLLAWNIENFHVCDYCIKSPTFTVLNLEKTEWIMGIDRTYFLSLKRIDTNSEIEILEVDVVVSVVLPNEVNNILLEKESKLKFKKDDIKYLFLFQDKITFEEENLKIYCHLRKSEEINASLVHCSILTRLQSEQRKSVWKIQDFRNLRTQDPKIFILESTGKQIPQIMLTGELSKKSKLFHISLSIPGVDSINIFGQISVLAINGRLHFSTLNIFRFASSDTVLKFSQAIPQAQILQQSETYLMDGDLSIMCDFFISNGEVYHEVRKSYFLPNNHKFIVDSKISNSSKDDENVPDVSNVSTEVTEQHVQGMTNDYALQQPTESQDDDIHYEYLDKKHCDVILTTENEAFPVHKCILCLQSPVFRKMFETDMKEAANKRVDINDLDRNTLNRFLLYLYTNNLHNLHWEIATKLFYAADKYQVTALRAKCSSFLKSNLTMFNVCEVLQLADLHQDEDLSLVCTDFVLQQDASEIFSSEKWKTFTLADEHQDVELKSVCKDFVLQQDTSEIFSSEKWKTFTRLGKRKLVSFSKRQEYSFSTKGLNSKLSELFLDNMIMFSCHIFMPCVKSLISEKCVAQTRVGVERICCPWRIENFSTTHPVVVSLYSSMSKSAHHLECKRLTWIGNNLLTIEIGRKQTESYVLLQVIGKISFLDVEGRMKLSAEDKYSFSSNVDTWKFQIPANKLILMRDCKLQQSNDKLLMLCDFTFFTDVTSEIIEQKNLYETEKRKTDFFSKREPLCPEMRTDKPSLLKEDFKNLYKKRIYSDVLLCSKTQSIPCHKAILCSRSPVFRAMFDNQMWETLNRKVEIPDLDDDTLHRFLLYLYSETLEHMDWMIAKKLLYAANKYEVKSLMNDCSSFLKSHLTTSNVCEALEFADMHQVENLISACEDLVFKHATEVFASSDWKKFSVKKPMLSAKIIQKYFSSKK